MSPLWKKALPFFAGLIGLHLAIGLWPGAPLSWATNLVLLSANLVVVFSGVLVLRDRGSSGLGLFALGYFLLFVLIVVVLDRESLFILLVLLYAGVYRVPVLLGVFVAFVLSYVVLQPYAGESFLVLAGVWLVTYRVYRSGASRWVVGTLVVGLVFLGLVLFPLLSLLALDSPQTLFLAIAREDVRASIGWSLLSASLATLLATLGGVPLAYALSRHSFRGRALVETLIDLPILVPQSVTGIALLALLGPGSPLGAWLQSVGLGVAGRFSGVLLAQVFVASPFVIKASLTAFESVPIPLELAARTLGARPSQAFFRVVLPLASRGVLTGMMLTWARAVSELGALLLFASFPPTAPLVVHNEFLRSGLAESRPIAGLLLMICLWVFLLLSFGRSFLPLSNPNRPVRGVAL